jgi:protein HOOK3
MSEKADAIARLKDAERRNDSHRNEKADAMMRAEIDRLRLEM